MIARLLISPSVDIRRAEISKTLASHLGSGNTDHPDVLYHPDILYFPAEAKLGIEQARKIKMHFSLKPYSAKGRAVILENASSLTDEAQNALLKTLEELPENALLILGADYDSKLLPTVLSRCQIVRLPMPGMGYVDMPGLSADIEKLLGSTIEERFEYLEKLKDREGFLKFMTSYFHQKMIDPATHARSDLAKLKEFLQELLQAEEWAKQNVNIRGILEYLMLVMPKS